METERKYPEPDFADIRARLAALGAQACGTHFESNILFDTADLGLFEYGSLLRLREQIHMDHKTCRLAYKGRPGKMPIAVLNSFKVREEIEVKVDDFMAMRAVLHKLGYLETARYEKMREVWRMEINGQACEADLDTLPFMRALELEADPETIDSAARLLGLDACESSLKNYHELHQEWLIERNLPFSADIVFDDQTKKQIFTDLGLSF